MIVARIVTTPEEREDAMRVRIAVFIDEQGIAPEDELDALDETATHCAGYLDGVPVAAGRLVFDGATGKIGRMAVLAEHRRSGAGRAVLEALEREVIARGMRRFKLSAQLHARGFYERCGYTAYGEVYDDVGIPHIDMEKLL